MENCVSCTTIPKISTSIHSQVKSSPQQSIAIVNHSLSAALNLAAVKFTSPSLRVGGGASRSGGGGCSRRLRAVTSAAGAGPSRHREFSSNSLNLPLEPRSAAGKLLSGVLQNQRELFHDSVVEQLKLLADDRDKADCRLWLSSTSTESCLYRRIGEVALKECQVAVADVLYMLVFYNFSAIKVHLVPKLSRCMYNRRLEIGPSNVWDLESIHSTEVLQMVREHIAAVIGLRPNSSVRDEWAPTQIRRLNLFQVYTASILYSYFLKSARLRHHMELSLSSGMAHKLPLPLPELSRHGLKNNTEAIKLGHGWNLQGRDSNNLRRYVSGFDQSTMERCAKIKSVEVVNLIEKHTRALFGNGKTGSIDTDEVISTSFASLKRLVLEAIAFGSFLWDAEEYVCGQYKLEDN